MCGKALQWSSGLNLGSHHMVGQRLCEDSSEERRGEETRRDERAKGSEGTAFLSQMRVRGRMEEEYCGSGDVGA